VTDIAFTRAKLTKIHLVLPPCGKVQSSLG
jgi:hypothetical protein